MHPVQLVIQHKLSLSLEWSCSQLHKFIWINKNSHHSLYPKICWQWHHHCCSPTSGICFLFLLQCEKTEKQVHPQFSPLVVSSASSRREQARAGLKHAPLQTYNTWSIIAVQGHLARKWQKTCFFSQTFISTLHPLEICCWQPCLGIFIQLSTSILNANFPPENNYFERRM